MNARKLVQNPTEKSLSFANGDFNTLIAWVWAVETLNLYWSHDFFYLLSYKWGKRCSTAIKGAAKKFLVKTIQILQMKQPLKTIAKPK